MTKIRKLLDQQPAETTFSGLGCWDIFKIENGRIHVGQVAMDIGRPPFVAGDGDQFEFAPGYVVFAAGLVEED